MADFQTVSNVKRNYDRVDDWLVGGRILFRASLANKTIKRIVPLQAEVVMLFCLYLVCTYDSRLACPSITVPCD